MSSDALEEALLHLKLYREKAEAAEREIDRLQRALGKEAQEKLAALGKAKDAQRTRDVYKLKLETAQNLFKALQIPIDPSTLSAELMP